MKSLPKALIIGWLFAASWETPLARADESESRGNESPSSQSVRSGPVLQRNALTDTAQASETTPASQGPNREWGFFRSWSRMAERTEAEQPDWLSPIATTSGRLKQEFRYDVWRQDTRSGETDYTLGAGKGLEFIVAPRLELMIGVPSYVVHTPALERSEGPSGSVPFVQGRPRDGFGDTPLMLKVRLASAAPKEGNYLVTLLLSATAPTGSHAVGMHHAVLSPGIALGKGWGKFDVQSTLGVNLPTGDIAGLGRQFLSNTAFQYRAASKLWPEFEVNSTSFLAGKNAGETQAFLTPGLGFGRVHLGGRWRFSAAAGLQIAATHFHTYNHRWMFSVRFNF